MPPSTEGTQWWKWEGRALSLGALGTTPPRLFDPSSHIHLLTLAHSQRVCEPLVEQFPNQKIFLPSWLGDFFLEEAWSPLKPPLSLLHLES